MSANYIKLLSKSTKLPIHSDLESLDMFCEYLLNDSSKYINFANLTNLYQYIQSMDPKIFMGNDAKMARYEFIRSYLEGHIDHGIVSRKMLLRYVADNVENRYWKIIQREVLDSINPDSLKKKDIEFLNELIFSQLNMVFMHAYKKPITKIIEDLESGEFGKTGEDCVDAIQLFQQLLNDLTTAQRRSKQDNRFNLTDKNHFTAIMNEACNRLLSEAQFWKTGWQGMNNMLNGGFENSRIYNFIGATGGFKSGLLLNIMKTVKLNNRGHEHKDPNKRPTILFLSQENNIWETILRLFGIFGTTKNIKNFSPTEIMDLMAKGGFCLVNDDLDIDIEFRYYGNMEIGVSDIRGIIEELDNSGREVIMVIQDYIERLKPPIMSADRRQQLNDVSNQLHDLAQDMDIPIITGSQLNRSGVATIEDMRDANKHDIGKKIGSKDISESFGMLKNFDVNISIIIEYDSQEERFYLSFRRLKFRGDDSNSIDYFLQPFKDKNSKIQLEEDINAPVAVFRRSMTSEMAAMLADEDNHIEDLTRRKTGLELLTELDDIADATDKESLILLADAADNINNSYVEGKPNKIINSQNTGDDMLRDENGFYLLLTRDQPNPMDSLSEIGTVRTL